MSNTLETKTAEQLTVALRSYNSYMCEIPDNFIVLDEYLQGLSQSEFCSAFKVLQDIVINIYNYLQDNPQSIGLVKPDRKTGELKVQTSQHISCIKKLLYTIGRVSVLDSSSLVISMDSLMNAYMTYYSNCSVELAESVNDYDKDKQKKFFETKHMRSVFECFEKFGFVVEGLDKEEFTTMTINYPKLPSVAKVIKAFAMPRICRVSFGFDFTKFNYRVFSHIRTAKLPLEDLYSFQMLPDENKSFLLHLNQVMAELEADYGECESGWYHGTQPCQYIYNNRLRVLQNVENGLMPAVVIKVGKKIDKIVRYIESLPEEYRSGIGKCRGCKKGDCNGRTFITAAGKKYALCNGTWWGFPPSYEAVPYIVEAYRI